MKILLSSVMFIFLAFCANLCASNDVDDKEQELKEYVQQRILNLCDQLDDIRFAEKEKYSYIHGFLFGKKTAYLDIWKQL